MSLVPTAGPHAGPPAPVHHLEDDVTATHPSTALTETIDPQAGRVRVRGHLTAQGVDLLRGTVANLHRLGHPHVVLDLAGVHTMDDGALDLLRALPDGDHEARSVVLLNAR